MYIHLLHDTEFCTATEFDEYVSKRFTSRTKSTIIILLLLQYPSYVCTYSMGSYYSYPFFPCVFFLPVRLRLHLPLPVFLVPPQSSSVSQLELVPPVTPVNHPPFGRSEQASERTESRERKNEQTNGEPGNGELQGIGWSQPGRPRSGQGPEEATRGARAETQLGKKKHCHWASSPTPRSYPAQQSTSQITHWHYCVLAPR